MDMIFVATPKGGAGKTTVADLLAAACTLGGRRVVVLDADAGNRGYLRRCGPLSAIEVDWETGHNDAAAFVQRHLEHVDTIIVDFGANLLASGTPILGFLSALQGRLAAKGFRLWTLPIASANAPGTDALVERMIHRFGGAGNVVVVANDTDGSAAYMLGGRTPSLVRLERIPSGVVAARLQRREPLASILLSPSDNHHIATAMIARSLQRFVTQPPLSDLVGRAAIERLNASSAIADGSRAYYTIDRLSVASDDAIRANTAVRGAIDDLSSCSAGEAWMRVQAYRAAHAEYARFSKTH